VPLFALNADNLGAAVVTKPNDAEQKVSISSELEQSRATSIESPTLTLLAEELAVTKEAVETGRVRISKHTHTKTVAIDEDLLRNSAEIETIPIGRQISEMPSVRHEGETMIIPIVEEVIHVERRLYLKEEIKITQRKTTEKFHDDVTLRYQEAVVTRVPSVSAVADPASTEQSK
jgi:uncharacterized protein (TIGR02271 family)